MKLINHFLSKHSKRVIGLDLLRSFSIVLVVHAHGGRLIPENFPGLRELSVVDGVSIFFVLSGFLIGRIILDKLNSRELSMAQLYNFWLRRWFRTVPNYLFVLILVAGLASFFRDNAVNTLSLSYLIFSQNFLSPHPPFFPEAWSLSIEEWFYLLFPAFISLLVFLGTNPIRSFLIGLLFFLGVPLILRIVLYEWGIGIADLDSNYRKVVILRLDSMMYGILGAALSSQFRYQWVKYKLVSLFFSVLLFFFIVAINNNYISIYFPLYYTLESFAVVLSLPFLSQVRTTTNRFLDVVIIYVSLISYSMYLLNHSVILLYGLTITDILVGKSGWTFSFDGFYRYALFWLYTLLFSTFLYFFFENPITNLREKFSTK